MSRNIQEFQDIIGYEFKSQDKLINALTHSSYANEKHMSYDRNNERLEFLGDAVLEVISSEFIFGQNPKMVEGKMTKLRASLVCEMSLAASARDISLGEFLLLGKGEKMTGGDKRDSILSDAFEAVIGAIYLDGGFEAAREFVLKYVLSDIEKKQLFYDSKTVLQEIIQARKDIEGNLSYELLEEQGPDHDKHFLMQCVIDEKAFGRGQGHTKKAAEQQAAYETILILRGESPQK